MLIHPMYSLLAPSYLFCAHPILSIPCPTLIQCILCYAIQDNSFYILRAHHMFFLLIQSYTPLSLSNVLRSQTIIRRYRFGGRCTSKPGLGLGTPFSLSFDGIKLPISDFISNSNLRSQILLPGCKDLCRKILSQDPLPWRLIFGFLASCRAPNRKKICSLHQGPLMAPSSSDKAKITSLFLRFRCGMAMPSAILGPCSILTPYRCLCSTSLRIENFPGGLLKLQGSPAKPFSSMTDMVAYHSKIKSGLPTTLKGI